MTAAELMKLFVLNDTKFTKQVIKDSGEIVFIEFKQKLTVAHLQKHLSGELVLGVFPVLDGKSKWFCIDIDTRKEIWETPDFDRESHVHQATNIAEAVKMRLEIAGIKSYLESTGGKGAHVWVFFDPTIQVKQALRAIVPLIKSIEYDKKIFDIEWFPNSESSKSVKLPEGINLRYNDWSKLEVPFGKIEYVSVKSLFKVSNPMESVFTRCRAFRELKEKADIQKHLNNKERVAIASMVWGKNEEVIEFVKNYYYVGLKNYSPEITEKNLKEFSKKYHPVTCLNMQSTGICEMQCQEIGNAKSPIEFYWDEIKNSSDLVDNKIIVDPSDKLIKKNGCFYELHDNSQLYKLSNITIDVLEQEEIFSENLKEPQGVLKGTVTSEKGEIFPFSMPLDDFTKNEKLNSLIYKVLRVGDAGIHPKNLDLLRMCINKFSKPTIIKKTRDFGFNSDTTVYYTPSVRIDKDSILPNNDMIVEIAGSDVEKGYEGTLDFSLDHSERGEIYWKNFFLSEMPKIFKNPYLTISAMGHVVELFIRHRFQIKENNSPYILWFSGLSGLGKSSMLTIIQRLFGKLEKPYNFSSTPARLEYSGYFFKDAIFAVDDFKHKSLGGANNIQSYIQIMQNYSDKTGRTRMTKDITARETYHVRGNFLGSGEDIVQHEGSLIARMIMLPFKPEDINVDFKLYNKLKDDSIFANEFTPHLIKWCLNESPAELVKMQEDMSNWILEIARLYQNAPRISTNYSKWMTGCYFFIKYLYPVEKVESMYEGYKNFVRINLKEQLSTLSEENPVGRFWNTLMELISTNQARINISSDIPDQNDRRPIVGFVKDGKVYLIHSLAFQLVAKFLERTTPLSISDKKLAQNLCEMGYYKSRTSSRMDFNGKSVRAHQINQEKLKSMLDLNKEEENVTT